MVGLSKGDVLKFTFIIIIKGLLKNEVTLINKHHDPVSYKTFRFKKKSGL